MTHKTTRRRFLAGATASAGATAFPTPSIAQGAPLKIGLLTVKTGPLAAGGIHSRGGHWLPFSRIRISPCPGARSI